MALFRLNRPGLIIYGGSMRPSYYNERTIDIVSSFESYGRYLQGFITNEEREGFSNYIKNGFWAMSLEEELPNEGLFIEFIVSIHDVTDTVLNGVNDAMTEKEKQSLITRNSNAAMASWPKENWQDVKTKSFYEGNQYFLFVTHILLRKKSIAGLKAQEIMNGGM